MKTTDMTQHEFAICKRAAAETMRMIREGYRYDVVAREWVKGKVTIKLTMVGRAVTLPSNSRATGPSTALAPLQTDIFTTGAQMYDIRVLAAADESRISLELNALSVSYKSNAKPLPQCEVAAAIRST